MKRKFKYFFVAVSLAVIIFGGCSKDSQDVQLQFKLQYDKAPLVITQLYDYGTNQSIQFTRISFFISDLTVSDGLKNVPLLDAEYINLTNSHLDEASAETGFILDLGQADISNMRQVNFNLGLNNLQNTTVPADYESGHPLANSAEYWIAWNSYIFAKIEGFVDLDGDQMTETSFALHLGSNNALRPVSIVPQSQDGRLQIVLDIKQVFDTGGLYDIGQYPQIHSLSQLDQINFLMDNLKNTIEANN